VAPLRNGTRVRINGLHKQNARGLKREAHLVVFEITSIDHSYEDGLVKYNGIVIEKPNGWDQRTIRHKVDPRYDEIIGADNETYLVSMPKFDDEQLPSIGEI
jgi:hypothetical protein